MNTALDTKLLPCPFCGNDGFGPIEDALQIHHNEPDYVHDFSHTWSVQCDKCTATMGYSDSEEEAIAAWNRRVSPSQGEGPAADVVEAQIAWEALEKIAGRADPAKLSPIAYEAAEAAAKIAKDALSVRGEIRTVDFPTEGFPPLASLAPRGAERR